MFEVELKREKNVLSKVLETSQGGEKFAIEKCIKYLVANMKLESALVIRFQIRFIIICSWQMLNSVK